MDEFTQVVACKAAIVRDGKLLLLRESSTHTTNSKAGQYQFPGGRIEPGEPFLEGLQREVREETGFELVVGTPFYVSEWFPKVRGKQLHIVGIFFLAQDKGGEVTISEEHDDYRWVGKDEFEDLPIMDPDADIVRYYFEKYKEHATTLQ